MSMIVGILVLLAVAVGGYFYFQSKQGPPLTPEMKAAQQEVLKNCKYDADFCKYAANGIAAMTKGYTMTSESVYNGKTTKMVFKTDGQNNSESVTYTDGREEGSFISLDKTTYMKSAGETTWTAFPPTKDQATGTAKNTFDFESLKTELTNATKDAVNTLEVKKVGTEKCGSLTCSVFNMTETTSNTTTIVWIDTSEFLARKMEVSSKDSGTSTMTFEYGPVTITKPSPVKEMPAFDSSSAAGATGVNMDEVNKLIKNAQQTGGQSAPTQDTPAE